MSKMKGLMADAKAKGADVLVFPELFSTGYTRPHQAVSRKTLRLLV